MNGDNDTPVMPFGKRRAHKDDDSEGSPLGHTTRLEMLHYSGATMAGAGEEGGDCGDGYDGTMTESVHGKGRGDGGDPTSANNRGGAHQGR